MIFNHTPSSPLTNRVSNEENKCNLDQQLSSKDLKTLQGHGKRSRDGSVDGEAR